MNYLKLFQTNAEKKTFIFTADNTPNVNYCKEDNTIQYKAHIEPSKPNNIIIYQASSKLSETTSDKNPGFRTDAFNTTIQSHEFSDGKGTITFNSDITSIGDSAFSGCSGLTSINYDGTTTQWVAITKGSNWKVGVPSNCMVHCTDGDIAI